MVCEHEYMNISPPNYRAGYSPVSHHHRKEMAVAIYGIQQKFLANDVIPRVYKEQRLNMRSPLVKTLD